MLLEHADNDRLPIIPASLGQIYSSPSVAAAGVGIKMHLAGANTVGDAPSVADGIIEINGGALSG
jgi:hypothetical protein